MSQDNVRLALWISGAWGLVIIIIVGIEAIVHDGSIAVTIVDTFSNVLFGLAGILGIITGVGKIFETKQAIAAGTTTAAVAAASTEPTSSPGGLTAPDVSGMGI